MTMIAKRRFVGGELTPSLHQSVDLVKYLYGLKKLRNAYVMKYGGIENRAGLEYLAEPKIPSATCRLIPYRTLGDTVVLEFGNSYIRPLVNGVNVYSVTKTITGITEANPAVVTSTSHGFSNGDYVVITGVVGMYEVNNRQFKVANVSTHTFELQDANGTNVDSTNYGTYSSSGSAKKIYEVASPYNEARLPDIKYDQLEDVLTLAHPELAPRELTIDLSYVITIGSATFAPTQAAPGTPTVTPAVAGSDTDRYKITAISSTTFEESLPSAAGSTTTATHPMSSTNSNGLSWSAASGAGLYAVYKQDYNGDQYGFIGTTSTTSFLDDGIEPDLTTTFPETGYAPGTPATVAYCQQRRIFAGTGTVSNTPTTLTASRIGFYSNFSTKKPIASDDAIKVKITGRGIRSVRHLLDLSNLVILSDKGGHVVEAPITPESFNLKQFLYTGVAAKPAPIVIESSAVFLQNNSSIIRDLAFQFEADGYRGNDLTIFASHLFEGHEIVDWSFQNGLHPILWVVRDDGVLLGMTYIKEQEILAWHRHDVSDYSVENVLVVEENGTDALYAVVNDDLAQVIGGQRKIVRMSNRNFTDVEDLKIMDLYLSYDGTNTNAAFWVNVAGGTSWDYTEDLTLTASGISFTSGDVGNRIDVYGAGALGVEDDNGVVRFRITAYTNSSTVTVRAHRTVPADMRNVHLSNFRKAVDRITGLWHLNGREVSVFADGFVVANPNNPSYPVYTVTNGEITLDDTYGKIHVGIPITSDVQTLKIDTPQGETLTNKKSNIGGLSAYVQNTRGVWAGESEPSDDGLAGLTELKIRSAENYDEAVDLANGKIEIDYNSSYEQGGEVFIRQSDPLPMTISSIFPEGLIPAGG